jgi:GTP-binding protein HflX
MRKIKLPSGKEVILSDTVGFISDLPHELVMSFRATLEEVLSADLVVHIRDVSSANSKEQKADVLKVLESLGFNDFEKSPKYIEVLNKIDLFDEVSKKEFLAKQKVGTVVVSAITGEGCDNLLKLIDDKLSMDFAVKDISLDVSDGKKIAWLHANSEVISCKINEDKMRFKVKISQENLAKFKFIK